MASGGSIWSGRTVLVVVAAPSEAKAVAAGFGCEAPARAWEPVDAGMGWRLLRSGVGKVNAAVAVARAIGAGSDRPIVLNLGVCGALPIEGGKAPLRSIVMASESVYADEGAITPTGFVDIATLGFPMWEGGSPAKGAGSAVATDPELRERCLDVLRAHFADQVRVGGIATVSTCSGTEASANETAARTAAIAEAMEGAAIAHALGPQQGVAPRFAEIRVVSNTTGDRPRQVWDLPGSLEVLSRVAGALRSA